MNGGLTCAQVRDRDVIPAYVAGKLPGEVAEAFEQHYFGCNACAQDVVLAGSIRATATADSAADAAPPGPRATRSRRWVPYVAGLAAMLVLAVVGWRVVGEPRERETVRSTSAHPLAVSGVVSGGTIELRWTVSPAAVRYQVDISDEDGTPLVEQDTDEPSLTISRVRLPRRSAQVTITVSAIDALGASIAVSSPLVLALDRP